MKYYIYKRTRSIDSVKMEYAGYRDMNTIQDTHVGTVDTEEECVAFIKNLPQTGFYLWIRGIEKISQT